MTDRQNNSNKKISAYGNWPSAISAELIVQDSISIDEPKLTAHSLYYIERRPQEKGRCVIVSVTDNLTTDVTPPPYSVRSRVNEFGGGSYYADDELLFFINDSDQDIYCINCGEIRRITSAENKRFADFVYDKKFDRLIGVCETHTPGAVINSIVSIDIHSGQLNELVQGSDFYASPRLDSTASRLCWQSWNHPNMPWDGNQLWLADIDAQGEIASQRHVAGGDTISVFQPQWSPDDDLFYIADDTGWWHIYRFIETDESSRIEQLTSGEKEFGLPQWVFAQSTYAFVDACRILCSYQVNGNATLALLSLAGKRSLTPLSTPWQEFSSINTCEAAGRACFIGASSRAFPVLVTAELNDSEPWSLTTSVIRSSCQLPVADDYYSAAHGIHFSNRHGQTVYANYYPPTNPEYRDDSNQQPPLIVLCHGGPTAQASIALDPKKQFWTSRGFALLDVNYGGSTGFGREYRLRLNNRWGELDAEDCCDAASDAVSKGLADKNHLIIRGSSAGGLTVLSALTFHKIFCAGASYYGISELGSLACDTHKFESRYLDRLVGPYPRSRTLYEQRSPINSTAQLDCPVIFFQGMDDPVVPREQTEKMFAALDNKGLPVAVQYFEGEQHGFRKAETIVNALENELGFYQLIFDLKPANEIRFKGGIILKNVSQSASRAD